MRLFSLNRHLQGCEGCQRLTKFVDFPQIIGGVFRTLTLKKPAIVNTSSFYTMLLSYKLVQIWKGCNEKTMSCAPHTLPWWLLWAGQRLIFSTVSSKDASSCPAGGFQLGYATGQSCGEGKSQRIFFRLLVAGNWVSSGEQSWDDSKVKWSGDKACCCSVASFA